MRRRLAVGSLVAVVAVAVAAPVSAPAWAGVPVPAPPQGVVLDATPPVAVAADAGRLAWLRPGRGGARSLVVRDPRGAVRVVAGRLPAKADELALGTDAAGVPTAVVGAPDRSKRGNRNSLWTVRADGGPARLRKLPASDRVRVGMTAPGLRRGVVSFIARGAGNIDGYANRLLQTAGLAGTGVRTVASLGSGYAGLEQQTAPAASGRVLVTQIDNDSAPGATIVRLRVYGGRDRGRTIVQSNAQTGDGRRGDNTGASGLGPVVVSRDGRSVTVSRWAAPTEPTTNDPVRAPRDLVRAEVLSGRSTRHAPPAGADVALALSRDEFAVFHADRREYNTTPRPARNASGALRLARG